ncbi:shaker-related potassium channel tsha2-like [Rhopilema esculentum]|uniref:shaker-related potassium channel tsha2-like n=1 Tax=Rhopilema esculentum TaxID=499914 RepID=UPI0031D4CB2B|eukprot:gene17222-8774_t
MSDRVLINVRGTQYETSMKTLCRFPDTLLGRKARQVLPETNNKISFSCRAETFDAILFYYQSNGILSRPSLISPEEFLRECRRFELDERAINKVKQQDGLAIQSHKTEMNFNFRFQELLYRTMESEETGISTGIYLAISSLMVLASIVLACTITIPSIAHTRKDILFEDPYFLTELTLNILFFMEYTLRLIASPRKMIFMVSALNVIDLTAFLPFFVILAVDPSQVYDVTLLKIVRIIRIVRVLRLAVKNSTMATVVNILNNCVLDILTMCMYILLTSVFWASMAFYAEMAQPNTRFKSIPDSMWWAVQTVLTIGYGDIIPETWQGKVIGSGVTALAAFTLTVPLLSLGGKLLNLYSKKFHLHVGPDLVSE